MDSVLARRSIRKYTNQEVSDEIVNYLLEAAMSAPSAANEQPWHFIVVRDRVLLNEITKYHPSAKMLKEASIAIIVCGDLELEKFKGVWVQDCSAATENILIGVQEKELGAVWLGAYPNEHVIDGLRKIFSLPNHIVPLSIVSIGYPAEKLPPANRYNESRIHYEKW